MAESLVNNAEQPRCKCGRYAEVRDAGGVGVKVVCGCAPEATGYWYLKREEVIG